MFFGASRPSIKASRESLNRHLDHSPGFHWPDANATPTEGLIANPNVRLNIALISLQSWDEEAIVKRGELFADAGVSGHRPVITIIVSTSFPFDYVSGVSPTRMRILGPRRPAGSRKSRR